MAYAAAAGVARGPFLDTRPAGGPLAHPLFPVCYEWPALLALRVAAVPPEVAPRGVHVSHDLTIHRLPRAGDRLLTTAATLAVTPRPAGTLVLIRLETVDAAGHPVSTTEHGTLYRGVATDSAAASSTTMSRDGGVTAAGTGPVQAGVAAEAWQASIPVPAGLAHVYTECAGIWNPIHTDPAVAAAAGLPGLILHGTATLALALSTLLTRPGGDVAGQARQVRRVTVRFGAVVLVPSTLTLTAVAGHAPDGGQLLTFDARSGEGGPALRDGRLVLGPP
jgi:acyl dehydratase